MRFNDALFGVALLALATFVWQQAAGFPKLPGMPYGPAFFPQVLAVMLAIAALLLTVRGILAMRSGGAIVQAGPWARDPKRWLGFLLVVGALVFYAELAQALGFHLTVLAIAAILMVYLGTRLWIALLVAVLTAILLWLLFARVLLVPLPGGLLAPLLW